LTAKTVPVRVSRLRLSRLSSFKEALEIVKEEKTLPWYKKLFRRMFKK